MAAAPGSGPSRDSKGQVEAIIADPGRASQTFQGTAAIRRNQAVHPVWAAPWSRASVRPRLVEFGQQLLKVVALPQGVEVGVLFHVGGVFVPLGHGLAQQ